LRFIGEKLRHLREARKWSQEKLASVAQSRLEYGVERSIKPGYISQVEKGKKNPGPEIVSALAKALRVDEMYFYQEDSRLPQDLLPAIPPELEKFLLEAENIPWLRLSEKAKTRGVPPEVLDKIIEALSTKN